MEKNNCSDFMQLQEIISPNNGEDTDNAHSSSDTNTVSMPPNDDDSESIRHIQDLLIMQLQQRNDSETWYPSKFESGIYALTKLFTRDDDTDSDDNIVDINDTNRTTNQSNDPESNVSHNLDSIENQIENSFQAHSEQNVDGTNIEHNTNETETRYQISNSDNLEIFDDRSDTFETNIDDIMNDSDIWSTDNSPRSGLNLEEGNNIPSNNEEQGYVQQQNEEEEYESDSTASEAITVRSYESEDDSPANGPEKLKVKPKVVEMYRVDVKAQVKPDMPVHERITVERTLHSIENAAKLRKLRKILENSTIIRPLEQGANKFNMVLGEIPDIIEVLKAYPDSSHHAHVRFINPKQESCHSRVGDVYIRTRPRKPLNDCSICLLTFGEDPVSTLCGHVFCENCLRKTIKYHKQCPTCRKQLRRPYFHKIFI